MTRHNCGHAIRAQLLLLCRDHHITPETLAHLYTETLKENAMHLHLVHNLPTPTAGDIGEDQEEWEVVPTHQPVEAPVETPAVPVPA